MQLLLQATWATDDPAVLLLAQERAFKLISMFGECSGFDLPFACPVDFSTSEQGWFPETWPSPPNNIPYRGQYVFGGGWEQTAQEDTSTGVVVYGVDIFKSFSPAIYVSSVEVRFALSKGTFSGPVNGNEIGLIRSGSVVQRQNLNSNSTPDGPNVMSYSFAPTLCDYIWVQVIAGANPVGGTPGTVLIDFLELDGQGTPPAGC